MITFAAFTPHSPLLLSSIGKENTKTLHTTLDAMQRVSEELYASHPDVLLTISTQRGAHQDAFSLNLHETYHLNFHEFGDRGTNTAFFTDLELASQIQRHMKNADLPFTLESEAELDYGIGVPLALLSHTPNLRTIIPVSHSANSCKAHVQFGRILKDVCALSKKRIAIIAAGDLSHTLSSDAPAGFHQAGEVMDQTILQSIEHMSLSQLLSLDETTIFESKESGLRPLLILFGILEKMHVRPEILSYEHPFGVGELVVQFHL